MRTTTNTSAASAAAVRSTCARWLRSRPVVLSVGMSGPLQRCPVAMPTLLVLALGVGVAALEKRVVVPQVEVVGLDPDAGPVHGIDVGREPAGGPVYGGAHVLHAVDHPLVIPRHLAAARRPAVALEDPLQAPRAVVATIP